MKIGLIIITVALVCLAAVGVMGFRGGFFGKEPGNSTMQAAIATGDYNAYLAAANSTEKHKGPIMNETQFDTLVQKYKDTLPIREAEAQIQQAIKDKDYNAWSVAMNALLEAQKAQITQANFDKIVQNQQKVKPGTGFMPGRKMMRR